MSLSFRYLLAFKYCFFVLLFWLAVTSSTVHAFTIAPVSMELKGDPGEKLSAVLRVRNDTDAPQYVVFSFANFSADGEGGVPKFSYDPDVSGLSSWMSMSQLDLTLPPHQLKDIPFAVRIPKDARPGGYYGAVIVRPVISPSRQPGASVPLQSQAASLVFLRVNGDVTVQYEVRDFGLTESRSVFSLPPAGFTYKVMNQSGTYLRPVGMVTIRHFFGLFSESIQANSSRGAVLSSMTRKFLIPWKYASSDESPRPSGFISNFFFELKYFAIGRYSATLSLADGGFSYQSEPVVFWVIPYHVLIVFGIFAASVALLLFFVRRHVRRKMRRHLK